MNSIITPITATMSWFVCGVVLAWVMLRIGSQEKPSQKAAIGSGSKDAAALGPKGFLNSLLVRPDLYSINIMTFAAIVQGQRKINIQCQDHAEIVLYDGCTLAYADSNRLVISTADLATAVRSHR